MTDSLFLALRSYRPTVGRDPLEDFVTEAWAWLLRNQPGLSSNFIEHIAQRLDSPAQAIPSPTDLTWHTQVAFERGRIDLVVEDSRMGIVFEHKVWSSLGVEQLSKYRGYAHQKWGNDSPVILVTAGRKQWSGEADLELTWANIYRLCQRYAKSNDGDTSLVVDFLSLLDHEGLGPPAPLSEESIRSFIPGQRFLPALTQVVRSLVSAEYWGFLYERISCASGKTEPWLRWKRGDRPKDGRLGIDLFQWWRPGIFVGVMLDGTDHRVPEPSHPGLGPDFTIILSYSLKADADPPVDEFVRSPEFTALRERLRRDPGKWEFVDHYFEHEDPNQWHPLHLRRPLVDVMRGTHTFEEQRIRFLDESQAAIEHLLSGGELETLVARVRAEVGGDLQGGA